MPSFCLTRHPFSLTSAPDDDHLSVHIRTLDNWSYQTYSLFQEVREILKMMFQLYFLPRSLKMKYMLWSNRH
ncbi:hypothetical protein GIB67_019127 [Kingdonia uniflora]|uniref:FAD-binding 8 domain-containing protein n=1 Tax=Kingdonia uniflora TaxID=39325 RepID=A0A7J7N092_9MAGN|nr:hypothetical protein GIB67_019127 [Kingdonia uniflora]